MPELNSRQRELLARTIDALDAAGPKPPIPKVLAQDLHAPIQAIVAIFQIGLETGDIVRLDNGFHFARNTLLRLAESAKEKFVGRAFSTAEIRDHFEVSRETANAILEYWDRAGLTTKEGGQRHFKPAV